MNPHPEHEPIDPRSLAMGASLAVSVVMLVGKCIAAWLSGSDAILSDASESVIHIFATGFAAFSLWYARQPPDRQHPYGHGKIAYLSIGAEGTLICIAGLGIIVLGVRSLIFGPELRNLGLGLLITAAMALINLGLGLFLIATGRRKNARVLVANGHHVLTDMWTSAGVVAGVLLVYLTGVEWLDPITALLAGAYIIYNAALLMREAYNGLMERVSEDDTRRITACLQRAVAEGLIADFHQVRFRQINDTIWIEAHLLFPPRLSLDDAHARATQVEQHLKAVFEHATAFVFTHLEPRGSHDKHHPQGHDDLPEALDTGSELKD